jgi:protein kinase C substrate 80K-H
VFTLEDGKSDLTKDCGTDDIFHTLKNIYIDKDSSKYIYELCRLGRTSQRSKKGGKSTGMGNFVRFDKIEWTRRLAPM